jgi:hypothetical protein
MFKKPGGRAWFLIYGECLRARRVGRCGDEELAARLHCSVDYSPLNDRTLGGIVDAATGALVSYLVLFVVFTLIVGYLLRTRGRVFLDHVFAGDTRVVTATNFLLNVGFYLLCMGMLLLNVGTESHVSSLADAIRSVALRLGIGIVVVAVLHTLNVVVLALLIRRSGRATSNAP